MAIYRKLSDIPYLSLPKGKQSERGKSVTPLSIPNRPRITKRKGAREYMTLGDVPAKDIPGVIKTFRKLHPKRAMQIIILPEGVSDTKESAIARTHFVSSSTTLPETTALRIMERYKLQATNYRVVINFLKKDEKPKRASQSKSSKRKPQTTNKMGVKKKKAPVKKVAKKKATKTVKKVAKKPVKKSKAGVKKK